ncbi:hypothetical protein HY249_02915 [Candidatus Azambacteria bacterium]|nr:hypothetical protein [Candidatus Azambacteria bacterium]
MNREKALLSIENAIMNVDCITSAKIYGSWMFKETSVDCDVAVIVPSYNGIVEKDAYRKLTELRKSLSAELGLDVDLIPHTEDEFDDIRSPLWYPRYNPSLVFGKTIKGVFDVSPSSMNNEMFSFSDLTAYVILDNRTICRRQLLRSLDGDQGRIFVSKLIHGPGNALTHFACKTKTGYTNSPSDIEACFSEFDRIYDTDSSLVVNFIKVNKTKLDQECGMNIMRWYEGLVALVLSKAGNDFYNNIVISLSK